MRVIDLPIGIHKGTFKVQGCIVQGILHHPSRTEYYLYSNDFRFDGFRSEYFEESFKDTFEYSYWIGAPCARYSLVLSLGSLLLGEL